MGTLSPDWKSVSIFQSSWEPCGNFVQEIHILTELMVFLAEADGRGVFTISLGLQHGVGTVQESLLIPAALHTLHQAVPVVTPVSVTAARVPRVVP